MTPADEPTITLDEQINALETIGKFIGYQGDSVILLKLDAAIASLRRLKAREWVPVGDRLPEIDEIVMVVYPSDFNGEPVYTWGARLDDDDGWLWGCSNSRTGIRLGHTVSFNDIEADDDYRVTHWQPLPPAPKERT